MAAGSGAGALFAAAVVFNNSIAAAASSIAETGSINESKEQPTTVESALKKAQRGRRWMLVYAPQLHPQRLHGSKERKSEAIYKELIGAKRKVLTREVLMKTE